MSSSTSLNGARRYRAIKHRPHNVALILCDIRMPKVNGVEAIDFFKKEAPGIPVVVVTGYPDAELAAYLMKKGVKDYLVKPVEKQKLIDTVNKIVAQGKDFEY